MGIYVRVDEQQQTTNTFTLEAFSSQEMQGWASDYAPDLSELANILPPWIYMAIEYQYNQITSGDFTSASAWDYWTITWENGSIISETSSPIITNMNLYPLALCIPVDSSWNVIYDWNIQYVYDNSNFDTEFPLTKYQEWHNLWAVAVDVLTLFF